MIDTKSAPLPIGQTIGSSIPLAARTTRLFSLLAVVAAVLPLAVTLYWVLVDPAEIERLNNFAPGLLADFSITQRLSAALITVLSVLPLS
ncbi:MAG: hypothetical protein MO852_03270 [Candidatus Devosia euplotis]|nr:hypothetical protein [Candidatus Devosia euplotis]